jgi:hypothetical protein
MIQSLGKLNDFLYGLKCKQYRIRGAMNDACSELKVLPVQSLFICLFELFDVTCDMLLILLE